jgi:hypothetical protein
VGNRRVVSYYGAIPDDFQDFNVTVTSQGGLIESAPTWNRKHNQFDTIAIHHQLLPSPKNRGVAGLRTMVLDKQPFPSQLAMLAASWTPTPNGVVANSTSATLPWLFEQSLPRRNQSTRFCTQCEGGINRYKPNFSTIFPRRPTRQHSLCKRISVT